MKRRRFILAWLSLVLAGLMVAAACAPGAKEAKTAEQEVVLPFLADLSRVYGFWNVPRLMGFQDTVSYVNKELGGIAGRKGRVIWADHENLLSKGSSIYARWAAEDYISLSVCGSQENEAFHARYISDEWPVFSCGVSDKGLFPLGFMFGGVSSYSSQFGRFIDWLVDEEWDAKAMGRGPRLAFMTLDNPFGRGPITPATLAYAKSRGVEIVDTIFIPAVIVDPTTPLLRARDAGADWVYGQFLWQYLTPLLKELKSQGLALRLAGVSWSGDPLVIKYAGEAAEGYTAVFSWDLWEEQSDLIQLTRKLHAENNRAPEALGNAYLLGVMNALVLKNAIEMAVEEKGWDQVTGADVFHALETFKDKQVDIGAGFRFDYSRERHDPRYARIIQVRGGKWVAVSDWTPMKLVLPPELTGRDPDLRY